MMHQEKKEKSDVVVQAGDLYSPDAQTSSGFRLRDEVATPRQDSETSDLRNYGSVAAKIAEKAFAMAKELTAWRKWVAIVIGTLAAGVAAWLMNGCTTVIRSDAFGVTVSRIIVLLTNK